MFYSQTYGRLNIEEIPEKLKTFYEKHKDTVCQIIIGNDSQNFHDTKLVSVIAMISEHHGGIFFSEITRLPRISDVRKKLHTETEASLQIADTLISLMEDNEEYHELYLHCPLSIHIDAGNSPHGKTKDLIPELVGWVNALGYEAEIKPESFVASSIADKISK